MKTSRYNIFFEKDGSYFLYNTLTSSIIEIDKQSSKVLQSGIGLEGLPKKDLNIFMEEGVIVKDDCDEYTLYKNFYTGLQKNKDQEALVITIIPTYSCNIRCSYCYQGSIENYNEKVRFFNPQIERIIHFIHKSLENYPTIKEIVIDLFGGEPLLYQKQLESILTQVRNLCKTRGLKYRTSISTNGLLINQFTIDQIFIPNNMRIQLTIDGIKSTHDTKRVDKQGNGTYDKIVSKIMLLYKHNLKNNIIIRVNIDKNNISEIRQVIDKFTSYVKNIYLAPMNSQGNNSCHKQDCLEEEQFVCEVFEEFSDHLDANQKGSDVALFGKKSPCSFNSNRLSYFIDYRMNVYTCDGLVGISDFCIGSINEHGELILNQNYYSQKEMGPFENEQCRSCILLPLCAGGCFFKRYIHHGDINKPFCEKSQETLIKFLTKYISKKS